MNHFQTVRCGFSSQDSAKTTARKIAKSVVGNSIVDDGGREAAPQSDRASGHGVRDDARLAKRHGRVTGSPRFLGPRSSPRGRGARDPRHRPRLGARARPPRHRDLVRGGGVPAGGRQGARRDRAARDAPHGYGCAGSNAVSYGLACLELEAGDSGFRSFVSVQGVAVRCSRSGSSAPRSRRSEWLPRMAAGEAIGCFGLTEPDVGSRPGSHADDRPSATATTGCSSGTKMWITNGSVADVAIVWASTDDGIRGFVVPTDDAGVHRASDIHRKLSLRASRDVRARAGRRAAAGRRGAARRHRAEGAAVVPERGAVRDRVGRRWARRARASSRRSTYAKTRDPVRASRSARSSSPSEARRHGGRARTRGRCSRCTSGG